MKKNLLMVGLISGLGIAGLASCGIKGNNKETQLTRSESLSMQAATSLSMVNNLGNSKSNLLRANKIAEEAGLTDAEKQDIKEILPTLDLMLSNSSSFDSHIENGDFAPVADDETVKFNTKEVVAFLGTDGKASSYTLFYNIELAEPETPAPEDTTPEENVDPNAGDTTDPNAGDTTDPNTGDTTDPNTGDVTEPNQGETVEPDANAEIKKASDADEDDEEDENETEIKTEDKISGLAFIDEATYYTFDSKIETEVEGDESEEERTFKINTAENSFIQVKQEHEVEGNEVETEFKYTVVENGLTTLEYSIEIENEDNQLELGYEIGGKEYELVKEEIDGETIYHVEYENEETDIEALISFKKHTDEETGEVTYEEII